MEYCWQCGNLLEHGKVDFCTSHCATLYYADEDADEDEEEEQDETPEPPDVEDEGMVDHDDEDRRAYHEERLRRPTG